MLCLLGVHVIKDEDISRAYNQDMRNTWVYNIHDLHLKEAVLHPILQLQNIRSSLFSRGGGGNVEMGFLNPLEEDHLLGSPNPTVYKFISTTQSFA